MGEMAVIGDANGEVPKFTWKELLEVALHDALTAALLTSRAKPMSDTSFRLYFPVGFSEISTFSEISAKEPATRDTDITTPNGKATVLLAEDEEHMLHLLEKILSKHGYKVLKASDGETAIRIYQRHKKNIDVVMLDIGLPKMAGLDVLLKIKQEEPDVKVVIASGYLEPELRADIDRAGVKYFLQKPYMLDEVVKIFETVIEREAS